MAAERLLVFGVVVAVALSRTSDGLASDGGLMRFEGEMWEKHGLNSTFAVDVT